MTRSPDPVCGTAASSPGATTGSVLSPRTELDEIDAAVRTFTSTGKSLDTLSPASFPLPSLGPFLREVLGELA
jgi:hypothetical protein